MNVERKGLIRYRLEMAWATLNDALLLRRQGGSPWGITNRAYDAMFYAVLALLNLIGKGASKHTGALALFNRHFIKTGEFPPEMSRWLPKAFDLRQINDYREFIVLGDEEINELLPSAEAFLQQVETYLTQKLD